MKLTLINYNNSKLCVHVVTCSKGSYKALPPRSRYDVLPTATKNSKQNIYTLKYYDNFWPTPKSKSLLFTLIIGIKDRKFNLLLTTPFNNMFIYKVILR